MSESPLRVLCLDIEGGYGGSSRSLWEMLRHIDRNEIDPEVWCRKAGPAQARYQADKIDVRVMPTMPTVSALPKISRNLLVFSQFFLRSWPASAAFRKELLQTVHQRFDLLHCNHESLFMLGGWLHNRLQKPMTFHIRTNLWDTPFARRQVKVVNRVADRLVFITENERETFERLLGEKSRGQVIMNAVSAQQNEPQTLPDLQRDDRFKIACLSNFSWNRGIDRLVDLAAVLARNNRRDILFVVAGNMQLPRSLPGELGKVARSGGTLKSYAEARGVSDSFLFLGHVEEPERVLISSDALIKPTREANPWGRDIIEALSMARPVITLGHWDGFVCDGETGILHDDFDAEAMAGAIAALADNRERTWTLGHNGKERIDRLCNPVERATDLANLWRDVASRENR